MRRWMWSATAVAMLATTGAWAEEAPATEEGPVYQYVGVEGCKTCHKKAKTGDQYGKWLAGPHAGAFETLASDKAKEIATARDIADPQKADECLQCHVTAHGVDAKLIATPRKGKDGHLITDGVACETCHGAGSEYKGRKVMKSREASIAAGMIIPDKALCVTCHNDESPTYKPFDYEKFSAKIAHPNPERVEAAAQ